MRHNWRKILGKQVGPSLYFSPVGYNLTLVKELRVTNAVASGSLPVPLIQALAKNDVASVFVPKKFGGSGFCEKDKLLVMEKLGADLSIFLSVNQLQIAASLITTLGTDEQKVKYLPKIGLSHSR